MMPEAMLFRQLEIAMILAQNDKHALACEQANLAVAAWSLSQDGESDE